MGVAAEQVRLDLVAFFHGGLGVDGGDGDACALQSSDLIVLSRVREKDVTKQWRPTMRANKGDTTTVTVERLANDT